MILRFFKYTRRFLVGLLIALPILIFSLQIPRFNTKLTEVILNYALSSKEIQFKIQKTSGQFPFGVTLHKIDISDKQGICLKIDKVKLSWKGIDLLFGKLNFDRISLKTVTLQRIPSKLLEVDDDPIWFPRLTVYRGEIEKFCIPSLYEGALGLHITVASNRQDEHFVNLFLIDPETNNPSQDPIIFYTQKGIDYDFRFMMNKPVHYFRTLSPYKIDHIQSGDLSINAQFQGKTDFIYVTGNFAARLHNLETTLPELQQLIGQEGTAAFTVSRRKDILEIKNGSFETQTGTRLTLSYQKSPFVEGHEHLVTAKLVVPHCDNLFPSLVPISGEGVLELTYNARAGFKKMKVNLHPVGWNGVPDALKSTYFQWIYSSHEHQFEGNVNHTAFQGSLKGKMIPLDSTTKNALKATLNATGTGIHLNLEAHIPSLSLLTLRDLPFVKMNGEATDLRPLGQFLSRRMGGSCSLQADLKHSDSFGQDFSVTFSAKNLVDAMIPEVIEMNELHLTADIKKDQGPLQLTCQTSTGDLILSTQLKRSKDTDLCQLKIHQVDYLFAGKKKVFHVSSHPIQLAFSPQSPFVQLQSVHIPQFMMKVNEGELYLKDISFLLEDGPVVSGVVSLKNLPADFFNDYFEEKNFQGTLNGKLIVNALNKYNFDLSVANFGLKSPHRKQVKVMGGVFQATHTGEQFSWKGDFKGEKDLQGVTHLSWTGSCRTDSVLPSEKDPLHSSFEGMLDLSFLNGFFNVEDRYKGIGKLALRYKDGVLDGGLSLEKGYYENAAFGTILKNIEMQGKVIDNKIKIEKLEASDIAKGKITGRGSVDLQNLMAPLVDIHFDIDKILAANTDEVMLLVSGNLNLKGGQDKVFSPELNGKITIQSALIDLNSDSADLKNIRIYKDVKELEHKKEKMTQVSGPELNIDLHVPKKLYIQGYGLHSEWHGDLRIRGKGSSPKVEGKLLSLKGHLDVANKRLILVDSHISFTTVQDKKGEHLVPMLHIQGRKIIGEYTAYVIISGLATEPKFLFTSSPALSTEEVISLILFNKPLKNASAAQALQLATALANIKAGSLSGGMFDSLNQILGVDELGFGDDSGDELTPSSLRIGKQLTDRIYVGVDQGIHAENQTKAKMKIDLTENTKIDLETGTQDSSIGYNWEMRY